MERQQLLQLFERYLRNQCTDAEMETLLHHFGERPTNESLKELILEALQAEANENFAQREDVKTALAQTDDYFIDFMAEQRRPALPRFAHFVHYGIAAAVLLACAVGLYVYQQRSSVASEKQVQVSDADPAIDKAVLTLADGSKITLDGSEGAVLLEDEGVKITKTADGKLIYAPHTTSPRIPVYNEITTPRGGQYQIILPDGSKVWLNAASTLKYPVQFSDDKRIVELEGEAYFEVQGVTRGLKTRLAARGTGIPFIVKTQSQEIEVLGTQFNVSAYANEPITKTTLVEGSVRAILSTDNASSNGGLPVSAILKPGQQAVSMEGNMRMQEVDLESEIGWKNGYFAFHNMPLADIIKHLSRWYDVDIADSKVPHTRYTVFISRQVKLSNVLEMLEKTGNLQFALNKTNHIVITPKTEKPM